MSQLYGMMKGIDDRPFTGVRDIEPTKVVCRGKSLRDTSFGPYSMLGSDRETYYANIKKLGLTPEREYVVVSIEGYGDVFDVTIQSNDLGKEASYMESMFEPPKEED